MTNNKSTISFNLSSSNPISSSMLNTAPVDDESVIVGALDNLRLDTDERARKYRKICEDESLDDQHKEIIPEFSKLSTTLREKSLCDHQLVFPSVLFDSFKAHKSGTIKNLTDVVMYLMHYEIVSAKPDAPALNLDHLGEYIYYSGVLCALSANNPTLNITEYLLRCNNMSSAILVKLLMNTNRFFDEYVHAVKKFIDMNYPEMLCVIEKDYSIKPSANIGMIVKFIFDNYYTFCEDEELSHKILTWYIRFYPKAFLKLPFDKLDSALSNVAFFKSIIIYHPKLFKHFSNEIKNNLELCEFVCRNTGFTKFIYAETHSSILMARLEYLTTHCRSTIENIKIRDSVIEELNQCGDLPRKCRFLEEYPQIAVKLTKYANRAIICSPSLLLEHSVGEDVFIKSITNTYYGGLARLIDVPELFNLSNRALYQIWREIPPHLRKLLLTLPQYSGGVTTGIIYAGGRDICFGFK